MPTRRCRAWLAAALGSSLLLGCAHDGVRPTYPPDPLFASKKPVEGRAETSRPVLAHTEPAAPPRPSLDGPPKPRLPVVEADPLPPAVRTTAADWSGE